MKNLRYYTCFIVLGIIILSTTSCDKIKKAIFNSFSTNGGSIDFSVDVITDTSMVANFAELSNHLNIDSVIRVETKGNFDLDDIDKISVEFAEIVINNPDSVNNISNFETAGIVFNTNTNTNPVNIATGVIPDSYADRFQFDCSSLDLKGYLRGTELVYVLAAKARRATTKQLDCTLNFRFKIE